MKSMMRERMTGADLKIDVVLLLIVVALLAAGLITVASTSWGVSFSYSNSVWDIFLRQLVWAVVGIVFMAVMYRIDYHIYLRAKWLVVLLALATLVVLVLVLLRRGDAPTRVGLLGYSVQPSELAKFVTIIYLSVWLVSKADVLHDLKLGLIPYAALLALFAGLIVIEPDYSAAVTVTLLGFAMFYFGGGKMKDVLLASLAIVVGGILLAVVVRPQRITEYLAGWRNIREANLQIREAPAPASSNIFRCPRPTPTACSPSLPRRWASSARWSWWRCSCCSPGADTGSR